MFYKLTDIKDRLEKWRKKFFLIIALLKRGGCLMQKCMNF